MLVPHPHPQMLMFCKPCIPNLYKPDWLIKLPTAWLGRGEVGEGKVCGPVGSQKDHEEERERRKEEQVAMGGLKQEHTCG